MKILMFSRNFPPDVFGGAETTFQNLYKHARQQHQVCLITGWVRARSLVPPEAEAIDLSNTSQIQSWAKLKKAMWKKIKNWKPDIILLNGPGIPTDQIPTACIVHETSLNQTGLFSGLKKGWELFRLNKMNVIITVSAHTARSLSSAGIAESKIRVVPTGVDTKIFKPRKMEKDSKQIHFLFPARISPGKGQHHAIDAFARLSNKHKKKSSLTIVGALSDPDYLDQLRLQAHGLPVRFDINVPEIVEHYQESDVILLPITSEAGYGSTAIEALSCAKPIIWFDSPVLRETMGALGIPIPMEDVDKLRDAMARLIENENERKAMGELGRKHAIAIHSWERIWRQYENALQSVKKN